jgi:hypothetical protein
MKAIQAAFLYLHYSFVLFLGKNIGAKSAHKIDTPSLPDHFAERLVRVFISANGIDYFGTTVLQHSHFFHEVYSQSGFELTFLRFNKLQSQNMYFPKTCRTY